MQVNSLPLYPEGRDLEIADYNLIIPVLRKYPAESSDMNFTNIFAWRNAYRYKISQLDGVITILGFYEDKRFILTPIGDPSMAADAAYSVFLTSVKPDAIPLLAVAPDWLAGLLKDRPHISISPSRADWDYVYRSSDLAELPGQNYHAKRNLIKQFRDKYTAEVEELNKDTCAEAIEFSDKWCRQRDCESEEGLEIEKCAIYQMLTNFEALKLHGILVRIDGEIVALTIGEEINPDTYVVHVEKGDQNFRGIYQFTNQQLARHVAPRYKWINREQDLGVPGLRRAKTSYYPHHFIEKFRVEYVYWK